MRTAPEASQDSVSRSPGSPLRLLMAKDFSDDSTRTLVDRALPPALSL